MVKSLLNADRVDLDNTYEENTKCRFCNKTYVLKMDFF